MTKEKIVNLITSNGMRDLDNERCFQAMEEYANLRLSEQKEKHEQELKKLYEWLLSDKKEPAQTYFTSGIVRNIAKEIEFKHDKEMEELCIWLDKDLWVIGINDGLWYGQDPHKGYTFTELITKFKNR